MRCQRLSEHDKLHAITVNQTKNFNPLMQARFVQKSRAGANADRIFIPEKMLPFNGTLTHNGPYFRNIENTRVLYLLLGDYADLFRAHTALEYCERVVGKHR